MSVTLSQLRITNNTVYSVWSMRLHAWEVSSPYSGLNLPHDWDLEERYEDPVNDPLVQEYGREKPHPLLWAESRSRPGELADVVETPSAHFTTQQLCVYM
jgi:hypothetical protein